MNLPKEVGPVSVGGVGATGPEDVVTRAKAALVGIHDGPWKAVNVGNIHWGVSDGEHGFPNVVYAQCSYDGYGNGSRQADARFIAAARSLVPELIAEVERLRTGIHAISAHSRLQAIGTAARGDVIEGRKWADILSVVEPLIERGES